MPKAPGFYFFPGDWMKDPGLRRCSWAARGFWMELLCLAFQCDRAGVLATNGVAWTDDEVCQSVTGDASENKNLLAELERNQVFSRLKSGAIYSRKMAREERHRNANRSRTRKWRESKRRIGDASPNRHKETACDAPCDASVTSLPQRRSPQRRSPTLPQPNTKTNNNAFERSSRFESIGQIASRAPVVVSPASQGGAENRSGVPPGLLAAASEQYGERRCQDAIAVVERAQAAGKCTNPAGLFRSALENGWRSEGAANGVTPGEWDRLLTCAKAWLRKIAPTNANARTHLVSLVTAKASEAGLPSWAEIVERAVAQAEREGPSP